MTMALALSRRSSRHHGLAARSSKAASLAVVSAISSVILFLALSSGEHHGPGLGFTPLAARGSLVPQQAGSLDVASDTALDRRAALLLGSSGLWSVTVGNPLGAGASEVQNVVVAGATGQTGRRILERLAKMGSLSVTGGVRDVADAQKKLAEAKVEIRGFMMDKIDAVVDTKGVSLKRLDVKDSVDAMAKTLQGANALVIATGFIPGNPFELSKEAHAVDNVGTVALIDAAKKAGVTKVVLVTSILTNARAWGQENSAGFLATNIFGGVLDEKLVAEKYLRSSGLDYTIVRPGGLKSTPPSGNLVVNKEDTTSGAEISRDLVADVCIAALFDSKASNKVVEIIEDDTGSAPQLAKDQWFAKLA